MVAQISNVRKSFGADEVLSGVTFRIESREKIALVGRNGAGKTTLVKILTGDLTPDEGTIQLGRGVRIGYLSQHSQLNPEQTVLQAAEQAREELLTLQARLDELTQKLEHEPTDEDLDEYARLHEHFIDQGGYDAERDVQSVLKRMGFEEDDWAKPVKALSGGERTRLTLARLLLEEPDLLILDEPTNHLDLEATEWLESWIRNYGGAVLLVSHDRVFLQNVTQRVIEMRFGAVKSYPGNFEKFLELRAAEDERQAVVAESQQEEIAKLDEFVRRFMNSQRTAQARGRLKQMEKLKAVAVEAPKKDKGMAAGFGKVQRAGDIVIETKGLSMSFGEQKLFQHLDWTVRWGERWGVIGANGAGKSTLLKVLLGRIDAVEGRARMGANVQIGVFMQDAENLDLTLSPLEQVIDRLGWETGPARNLLGRFLITGDDVFRPIRTLSGGERNKLALALLTAENPNVLFLDEPTNHLDMPSREALAKVLKEYQGTLILVSHDRWLLGEITSQTLDVRIEGSMIYQGSYPEYRAFRDRKSQPVAKAAKASPVAVAPPVPTMTPRELSKEIARLEKEVAQTEDRIHAEEQGLETLEREMATPAPGTDLFKMSTRHGELQKIIRELLQKWEADSLRLQELVAIRDESTI